ncbi:hypothetical protein VP1G_08814 [Cytospora mali]|uniref:Uncharacterized protein n=1 Tax=Cytospora mali TaxID=578113 RepID=A0A194VCE4_CYTMA|nr:hypothetical protein VP1G_08814 [Valsa mali var. pyri (nom. inval.)]
MALEAKIRDTSARNSELLRILHETESAIPALEAQKRYVADLEKQVADATNKLTQLAIKRKQELKEHESYRDSVMKRFAYKVSGKTDKFDARAAKEEREYFDILQEEHQADVMKNNLATMLIDAKGVRDELTTKAATHSQTQKDLDSLYESIFTGPSPGFPEEDERERATNAAVQAYQGARSRAEAEVQAVSFLNHAQKRLAGAMMCMQDALQASRMDMFGGGTFTDMMERSALSQAENQIQNARMMVRQARQCSPLVRDLPPVRIAQGHILGDIFFDNIFTDMAFHQKIEQSNLEVQQCARALNADLVAARQRHAEVSRETEQKRLAVQQARMLLQKVREAAFERISGNTGQGAAPLVTDESPPEGPPPRYTERADISDEWWQR